MHGATVKITSVPFHHIKEMNFLFVVLHISVIFVFFITSVNFVVGINLFLGIIKHTMLLIYISISSQEKAFVVFKTNSLHFLMSSVPLWWMNRFISMTVKHN